MTLCIYKSFALNFVSSQLCQKPSSQNWLRNAAICYAFAFLCACVLAIGRFPSWADQLSYFSIQGRLLTRSEAPLAPGHLCVRGQCKTSVNKSLIQILTMVYRVLIQKGRELTVWSTLQDLHFPSLSKEHHLSEKKVRKLNEEDRRSQKIVD